VEAAQSLGAGPLWILRRYLLRNVNHLGAGAAHLKRCRTPSPCWRPGPSWAWGSESIRKWGADLQAGSQPRWPTGIWVERAHPGWRCCVGTGAFRFLGEGLEGLG